MEGIGDFPSEKECFPCVFSMLEERGMQGGVFLPDNTSEQKFILICVSTHLSIGVGAHSRRFLWLHYGADQDVCDQYAETTTRHISVCFYLHVFLCIEDEGSVSLPEHPAKHKHLQGKLYLPL